MQAVSAFCESKEIKDVDNFMYLCFKQGFDIKKYGFLGNSLNEGEKHLKTEVIVEKRVEIPVEVIKEVEVPVEIKVIEYVDREVVKEVLVEVPKEKIVTKIEYISDKKSENELVLKIHKLEETILHLNEELESERQEFSTKTEKMSKIFQDEMSNKDDNLDELRHNLDVMLDELTKEKEKNNVVNIPVEVNTDNSKQKMLESTLQNTFYGLALQFPVVDEQDSLNKGNIKFFSTQTHTIHQPTLEIVWDTQTVTTGSLLPIPSLNVKIVASNLRETYTKGDVDKGV